ncbi:kinase-like domain-containing protein [Thelephora terrestris]|uniref:Kinase-like domain-containing protein n=1 Tax=Thelephora terrestris TaxID=56493 RepID=A0A9P6L982_9AGAM|nr:kinase-like domain-containing protein [Thelephora terrestris]
MSRLAPVQQKRYPLTDVNDGRRANHHQQPPSPPPPQKEELVADKPKRSNSPPLPRQNAKVTPPSPPKIIIDQQRNAQYVRIGLLGEGGFARVYEVKDFRGARQACKVVTKSSLKTKKAKTKLYAEIKIHKSLSHPNIVLFKDCFEDEDNVYMTLELCPNRSLMDMLRRRRRFTDPEVRFLMVQLIGACRYMHTNQVIHRDLKLGNLFLDAGMNVKVGDFGLAALIENPGERKKTICGTPNYIAPEVLFDTANGHSFEVDTWSIGVILYTLVIGRPPFQTKEVKAIYKRIRDNEYEFPNDSSISIHVQELIQQILTPDPSKRPTLHQIVDHQFFTEGTVPSRLPSTAHDSVPDFSHISRTASKVNLANLRAKALLDDDNTKIAVPSAVDSKSQASTTTTANTSTLAQQEKEFLKAVQPGSPISALLSSARQPLVMSTNNNRESSLIRKLQAARLEQKAARQKSPVRPAACNMPGALGDINEEVDEVEEVAAELRKKELESQKARIVAQMVPGGTAGNLHEQENDPQAPDSPPRFKDRAKTKDTRGTREPKNVKHPARPTVLTSSSTGSTAGLTSFEAAAHTLTLAFEALSVGKLFRDPQQDRSLSEAKVFIVSWVDFSHKYGMGYALTDGSVGVRYNDSTSIIVSPDKAHLDYVTPRRQGAVYVRKNHSAEDVPEELAEKMYLLNHFESYIMNRLYGDYDYTYEDHLKTTGMDFVQKYLRMKHVVVFMMSSDVIQFNFYDHSKVILSSQALAISHIDKHHNLTTWTLSEVMMIELRGVHSLDQETAKTHQRLLQKLKYCKEVLVSIRNESALQHMQGQPQLPVGAERESKGLKVSAR